MESHVMETNVEESNIMESIEIDVQDPKPWVTKALLAGRTPLPDAAPRPRVNPPVEKRRPGAKRGIMRSPWTRAQISQLLRLKAGGAKWDDIMIWKLYFPTRTLDGVKQTYWKHRSVPEAVARVRAAKRAERLAKKKAAKKAKEAALADADAEDRSASSTAVEDGEPMEVDKSSP